MSSSTEGNESSAASVLATIGSSETRVVEVVPDLVESDLIPDPRLCYRVGEVLPVLAAAG